MENFAINARERGYSSVVEHSTADREVTSSILVAPYFFFLLLLPSLRRASHLSFSFSVSFGLNYFVFVIVLSFHVLSKRTVESASCRLFLDSYFERWVEIEKHGCFFFSRQNLRPHVAFSYRIWPSIPKREYQNRRLRVYGCPYSEKKLSVFVNNRVAVKGKLYWTGMNAAAVSDSARGRTFPRKPIKYGTKRKQENRIVDEDLRIKGAWNTKRHFFSGVASVSFRYSIS